jgi:hypothetical protein
MLLSSLRLLTRDSRTPGLPGDVVEPLALEAVLSDSGPPGDVVEPLTLEAVLSDSGASR